MKRPIDQLFQRLQVSTLAAADGVEAAEGIVRLVIQAPASNSVYVMHELVHSQSIQYSYALLEVLSVLPTQILESDGAIRIVFDVVLIEFDKPGSDEIRRKICFCQTILKQSFHPELFSNLRPLQPLRGIKSKH